MLEKGIMLSLIRATNFPCAIPSREGIAMPGDLVRLLLALATAVWAPLPAAAQNESCELAATADGFVALRRGPSPHAKRLVRMDPKGAVIPRTDRSGWERGNWILVSYWRPGIDFKTALKIGPIGWMNRKLHEGCG
jgi:hypothetical protein